MASGRENPFKPEDLEHILKEEMSSSKEDGWQFAKKTDTVEIWKKDDENSSIKLVKAFFNFPGIPVTDMIELLYDIELRRKWESTVTTLDLIEDQPDYRIIYWVYKMPTGVSNRDLLQYATCQKDEERNFHYILYKNATDDRKPEVSGLVRAKTILSGVILRPDESDANSTRMSFLSQTDMMGWLPSFVTNMALVNGLVDWSDNLLKFYRDTYVKK